MLQQMLLQRQLLCLVSLPLYTFLMLSVSPDLHPLAEFSVLQTVSSPQESAVWAKSGATFTNSVWMGPEGKACWPHALFHSNAKIAHGRDHVCKGGKGGMCNSSWYTHGFSTFAQDSCLVCEPYKPRNWVLIKDHKCHHWKQKRFQHLFQVLLTTVMTVRVTG